MRRKDREITAKDELQDILERGLVCHLALTDGTEPYLIALNYGYSWNESILTLYFHCANSGKKLDIIRLNNSGFFFIDIDHMLTSGQLDCDWGMNYTSISGKGTINAVTDPEERKKGLDLLMKHYTRRSEFLYDEKVFSMTTILKLSVIEVTGKKKGSPSRVSLS